MNPTLIFIATHHRTKEFRLFRNACERLQVKKCNVDMGEQETERAERVIRKRFCKIAGLDTSHVVVPRFVQLFGDPRGVVAYVDGSKISDKEKAYCKELGMYQDWGGNFSIGFIK